MTTKETKEKLVLEWELASDAKDEMTIDQLEKKYKVSRGDIYTALIDTYKFFIIDNRAFTKMTDKKLNELKNSILFSTLKKSKK